MRKKTFLQRIRFKYRVSILNENTLEEAWHARISRMSVFIWTCLLISITFGLLALLILYTPIKRYLPGFEDSATVRLLLMEESFRVDSMMNHLELQHEYLNVIQDVIAGNLETDSIPLDSTSLIERTQLALEKSKLEQEFSDKYEEEARYNLPLITSVQDAKAYTFFKPVEGIITEKFSAADEKYGIAITTNENASVLSVLDGTIIFAGFTIDNDWVITIQHNDNYISTYKNNSRLLKKQGDAVKAGETIAIVENSKLSGKLFQFEIWKEGVAIDPQDLITL